VPERPSHNAAPLQTLKRETSTMLDNVVKRSAAAAAAVLLLAGSAMAAAPPPPCPKVSFTAADVVRFSAGAARAACSRFARPVQRAC